jgi:hypothetical protein
MYDGSPVGYFARSEFPRAPGRYRYVPYRGPGHLEMQKQCEAGATPRCYYIISGGRVSFTVRDCPVYGELVIDEFETSESRAA